VKPLVLAEPSALREVVIQWLDQRDRQHHALAPAAISTQPWRSVLRQSRAGLVVDMASHGRAPALGRDRYLQLLDACEQLELPYLLISDARVLGAADGPQPETAPPAPLNALGEELAWREQQLRERPLKSLILRSGELFGAAQHGRLHSLVLALRGGGELRLSTTRQCPPTHITDLARVLSAMLDQLACGADCWQTYHYTAAGATSCYEFAENVLANASQYWDISGVQMQASEDQPMTVPILACQQIRDHFGIKQLPWRSFLNHSLKRIHAQEQQQEPS
jgi:dTDP-4-dehydrorhamnose reductase